MTHTKLLTSFAALTLLALPLSSHTASAQDAAAVTAPAPEDAFAAVRAKMHTDMDVKPTGNIDKDFINNMIPHHKAAIEMAKIAMEKSKDPVTRKTAQNIIGAQTAEIKQMEARLKALDKK